MEKEVEISPEKLLLSPEEEFKIKTICEFLFFDQFKYYVTYNRFEQCIQPLVNDLYLSTDKIFKELAGNKKKYITYKRFINCYLAHKNKTKIIPKDVHTFFDILMTKLIYGENSSIGKQKEKVLTFSTTQSNKNRKYISLIEVLTDKIGIIHGLNLQYDDQIYKEKLYPRIIEDELLVSIQMNLGLLIDEKIDIGKYKIKKEKQLFYRDYVTHIFGTFNKNTEIISFLGFKSVSGKTLFVGTPRGEGFIFGGWGTKFHQLKIQMNEKGITYFQPIFNENIKINYYLRTAKDYKKEIISEDNELIFDEPQLSKLTDEIEIDKFITTPIISDDLFFDPKLKDEITGNDYKETVNTSRQWLLPIGDKPEFRKFLYLSKALKIYEQEKKKRELFKEKEKNKKKYENENKENNEEENNLRNEKENYYNIKKKKFHKNRKLIQNNKIIKNEEKKWDGNLETVEIKSILMNKENYQTLKNKLAKNILDDINSNEEDPSYIKEYLIEKIIPEIGELKGNPKKTNEMPHLIQKKINSLWQILNSMKSKKARKLYLNKNEYFEEPSLNDDSIKETNDIDDRNESITETISNKNDEEKNGTRKYYSDALQLFNELSNKNKSDKNEQNNNNNNEDNLFGFGVYERYFPGNPELNRKKLNDRFGIYNYARGAQYSCNENHSYITRSVIYRKHRKNNKTINVYNSIYNSVSDNMKNNNNPKFNYNYLLVNNIYYNDPKRILQIQNNWKYFSKEIKRVSGVYLLQTIGTIIKTIKLLKDELMEKQPISEKIKLYKLLEENQAVLEFLNKNKEIEKIKTSSTIKNNKRNKEDNSDIESDNDNDEFMLPDEHPEENLPLDELEEKLRDISILLQNRLIKDEQKKKLAILENLFLQQKNIFIENKTKKVKEEIINNNKELSINNLIKEEESKRKFAKREDQKDVDSKIELIEEESFYKDNNELSLVGIEIQNKIYRKQNICKTSGDWTDYLFSPQACSLCPFNSNGFLLPEGVRYNDLIDWTNFKWLKPDKIFDSQNYIILPEHFSDKDIIQGCLNNSSFLFVIGALCKYPNIIEKLLFIKEKTKEHIYGVYINIHGQWKLVLVDDNFPACENRKIKKFAFAHCKNKEIWVNLIEKAWAKINGCYAQIGANYSPFEIFDVLTEAYTEVININNNKKYNLKKKLWKKISNAKKNGFIIMAVSNNNLSIEKIGILPGGSYIISKMYEIQTEDEVEPEKILKLYNPWEDIVFSGDWGELSKIWTEELKEKINYSEVKEGEFFISFNDFINYFDSLGIVKLHEYYICNSIKISKNQAIKGQLIKLKIFRKDCHAYLQLYQKNPRIILSDGTYQKPELSYLILADKNFNYITSVSSNHTHLCIEQNLNVGEYYIFCDVNYRYVNLNQKVHGYIVTAYSNIDIQLENITEEKNIKECLQKVMISYCKNNIKPNNINNVNVYFSKSFNDELPFVIGYFENLTNIDNKISIDIKCKGEKSCCFYYDDFANEEDECIIKDLPAKKNNIFLIMKYSLESLFTINYLIISNEEKIEDKQKSVDTNKLKNKVLNSSKKTNKIDAKIVFNKEGQPLDNEPSLVQYSLEINGGYIIGLENTSKQKMKIKLVLEGLDLTDSNYKGRNSPIFFIDPKEKKTFQAIIKDKYTGDVLFKFELIKKGKISKKLSI